MSDSKYFSKDDLRRLVDYDVGDAYLPGGRTLTGIKIDLEVYRELVRIEEADLAPCVTVVLDNGNRYQGSTSSGSHLRWWDDNALYSIPIGYYTIIRLATESE